MLSLIRRKGLLSSCLVCAASLWAHDEHELFFGVEDRGGVTLNATGHEGFRMKVQSSEDGVEWLDFGIIDPLSGFNHQRLSELEANTPNLFRLIYPKISPYAGAYEMIGAVEFDGEVGAAQVTLSGEREIASNGLPNHATGVFPNAGNPNRISSQDFNFSFPLFPSKNSSPTYYNVPQAFGITREGVILDPFANEYYQNNRQSGWQLAALANDLGFDDASAHVQPDGTYHYHGVPKDLITTDRSPELIGFAGDGFPIYGPFGYSDPLDSASEVVELASSWQLRSGVRSGGPGGFYDGTYVEDYEFIQGSGDLDECNGRFGVTHEYPSGTYYYVITNEWPYMGRCFWGDIAESFERSGGPPPR